MKESKKDTKKNIKLRDLNVKKDVGWQPKWTGWQPVLPQSVASVQSRFNVSTI